MKKKSSNTDSTDSIRYLDGLKSLKVLKLKLNCKSITEPLAIVLIKSAIPIEHMRLVNGTVDADTFKVISKMKQLKVLELCDIDGLTKI